MQLGEIQKNEISFLLATVGMFYTDGLGKLM